MRNKSLIAFLIIVTLLSAGYVVGMKMAGQYGPYLAQAYMLTPAIAALITRLFFDPRKFSDANLRLGRAKDWLRFYLFSLAIVALYFFAYWITGAGRWDFSGQSFLAMLEKQFAMAGQSMTEGLPQGMTPQMMMWLYFVGDLTLFNILPGLVTGFGEEFGWRGLMFPRLYAIKHWAAFLVGGLIWFGWHLPLMLLNPQPVDPLQLAVLLPVMALGSICTFTYLAYAYTKTRSIWIASFAHIVMNNASAGLGMLLVVQNQFVANIMTSLAMVVVVAVLYFTGELKIFKQYFSPSNNS